MVKFDDGTTDFFTPMDIPPVSPKERIYHKTISLVGDDAETEDTLAIMQRGERLVELPSQEAIKFARHMIRALKENITSLEREILWVTDRNKYMTYYEDKKNDNKRV